MINQNNQTLKENIEETKEKLKYIRGKLISAKDIILEKTEKDMEILNSHIRLQNEDEIM